MAVTEKYSLCVTKEQAESPNSTAGKQEGLVRDEKTTGEEGGVTLIPVPLGTSHS